MHARFPLTIRPKLVGDGLPVQSVHRLELPHRDDRLGEHGQFRQQDKHHIRPQLGHGFLEERTYKDAKQVHDCERKVVDPSERTVQPTFILGRPDAEDFPDPEG